MFTRKELSDIPYTSEARTTGGNPHSVYLKSFRPRIRVPWSRSCTAPPGHLHHSGAGCF